MAKKSGPPRDRETTIKRLAQGMRANLAANGLLPSQVRVIALSYTDFSSIEVEIMVPGIERATVAPLLAVSGARYTSVPEPTLAYNLYAKEMTRMTTWIRQVIDEDLDQSIRVRVPFRCYPYTDRVPWISRGIPAHDLPRPVVLWIDGTSVLESSAEYVAEEIAIMVAEHR